MSDEMEKAFRRADTEFLQLSSFALTATVAQLQAKKAECIRRAYVFLDNPKKTLEETEYANMLLNFAECELAGIELPRH
jgi:hypothetical protein